MPADTFVRLALPRDVAAVAAIQARVWRASYADVLPPEVLDGVAETAAAQWSSALHAPPTDTHHLLVAIEFDQAVEQVVGFAAVSPSEDDDADPQQVGSLVALFVDPDHRGLGHGSRLLTAAVETLRANRFMTATTWQSEADEPMRRFLVSAGWAPDGARRELDTGTATITELRLHTTVV